MVWEQRPSYNNDQTVAQNRLVTTIKLLYYLFFAFLYGSVGSLASLVLVNSTWTLGHIQRLWYGVPTKSIRVVFPPCDVTAFGQDNNNTDRQANIVSIGQFRPEKDHALQIRAFALLLQQQQQQQLDITKTRLVLIGSCRNEQDKARVKQLQQLVHDLALPQDSVQFVLNQPYSVLQEWFRSKASVGLHTMWNEHFGIGVVEMMASGLIVVAHCSGGPKEDIVRHGQSGFLASSVQEYADALYEALTLSRTEAEEMRKRAKLSSQQFSDELFCERMKEALVDAGIVQLR